MSLRRDVARVVRLKEFHSRVEQLLTPSDRDYFYYALKEYNTYKSVAKLMLALNSCLDTPEKLDLLPSIREIIPRHDRRKFDNLAPYNRMAHPPSPHPPPSSSRPPREDSAEIGREREGEREADEEAGPDARSSPVAVRGPGSKKTVFLQRESGEALGFSIRGGREHELGIFVSNVDPFSLAEQAGLKAGDQILAVNGYSFESITHQSAVLILRSHEQLQISVAAVGHVPGQPKERKSLIWVDTSGNPVNEEENTEQSRTPLEEDHRGGDRLLESPNKHKVVLRVEREQPLGFSVRGGREFSLGIFVSQVDSGSPAEASGLKIGDQILAVNGHSFTSILHQEAVALLRAFTTLVITVRSLGRLPLLVNDEREELNKATPTSSTHSPPTHSTQETQEGADHTHRQQPGTGHVGHAHHDVIRRQREKRWSDWRKSVSRRSQSLREFFRPRSLYAPPPHHRHHRHQPPRSHSHRQQQQVPVRHSQQDLIPRSRLRTGSDGALLHHHQKPRQAAHSSPLTLHTSSHHTSSWHKTATSATSPPAPSGTSPSPTGAPHRDQTSPHQQPTQPARAERTAAAEEEERGGGGGGTPFFRYGVGTQLMLAAVSSSAQALLEDSARRCLDDQEMRALTDRLREYETNGGVETFAEFLVSLLDTPTKMVLLSDIRSVLRPTDLVTFDGIVSPHEIAALQKRVTLGNREATPPISTPPSTSQRATERLREGGEMLLVRDREMAAGHSERERREGAARLAMAAGSRPERDQHKEEERERAVSSREREGATRLTVAAGSRQERASGDQHKEERREEEVDESHSSGDEGREREEEGIWSEDNDTRAVQRDELLQEQQQLASHMTQQQQQSGSHVTHKDEERAESHMAQEKDERELWSVAEEEEEEEEEEEAEAEAEAEGAEADENSERFEEEEEGERETAQSSAQDNYNLVLYEIQSHGGQDTLRRAEVREGDIGSPHIGAFASEPVSDLLTRASEEEPSMVGMQTRESFMEWNEDYASDSLERRRHGNTSKNPVIVNIAKNAPRLGLTITGGADTPSPGVIITDVKEGGAAAIDGFLQPGFEIVQVDGVHIRGLDHDDAARALATSFRSNRPSIELIVIPV